ncbi:hypothetical protein LAZ67_1002005 [Cordylochernes scorpioides]|uniref:Uncharacterized protein n=1 Tax=Cordylochernes scorpioides TaxID=51811 RepID=A0ABY6JWM3_9ARAC|nr:hypothetical protein LAZ67_1002005 [Cordylochernes scorpioides]
MDPEQQLYTPKIVDIEIAVIEILGFDTDSDTTIRTSFPGEQQLYTPKIENIVTAVIEMYGDIWGSSLDMKTITTTTTLYTQDREHCDCCDRDVMETSESLHWTRQQQQQQKINMDSEEQFYTPKI